MTTQVDLIDDDLVLTGRIMPASNATFVGQIGDLSVVYKPIAGERPLWDFPDGNLAHREVAAYTLSEALAWNIVPHTWLREGPMGTGMVQRWQETDPEQDAVDLVAAGSVPVTGWCQVLEGRDAQDRPVALVHEDTAALRRMAVFDAIANNADRKGGHVLAMADRHRYGIDHGLTFHAEHKLRTVLWGWLGQDLHDEELDGLRRVRSALDGDLGVTLAPLLTGREIEALARRCDALLSESRFPAPHGEMPAVPWPPF